MQMRLLLNWRIKIKVHPFNNDLWWLVKRHLNDIIRIASNTSIMCLFITIIQFNNNKKENKWFGKSTQSIPAMKQFITINMKFFYINYTSISYEDIASVYPLRPSVQLTPYFSIIMCIIQPKTVRSETISLFQSDLMNRAVLFSY